MILVGRDIETLLIEPASVARLYKATRVASRLTGTMTKIPAKFSRCDRYCALGIGVLEAAMLTGLGANGDGGGEQGIYFGVT